MNGYPGVGLLVAESLAESPLIVSFPPSTVDIGIWTRFHFERLRDKAPVAALSDYNESVLSDTSAPAQNLPAVA